MERTFTGSIISAELGRLGKKPYGFISVETEEHGQLKIKIAMLTNFETLEIGKKVNIVAENIGDMSVMTAKSVLLVK